MRFAEAARDQLAQNGAATTLVTYEGGHGWHGDVFGNLRAGIKWLEEKTSSQSPSTAKSVTDTPSSH